MHPRPILVEMANLCQSITKLKNASKKSAMPIFSFKILSNLLHARIIQENTKITQEDLFYSRELSTKNTVVDHGMAKLKSNFFVVLKNKCISVKSREISVM